MLKLARVRQEPYAAIFYLRSPEGVVSEDDLERLARLANEIAAENRLSGRFRRAPNAQIFLDLDASARDLFHTGVFFAALDVLNNPLARPTLAMKLAGVQP
jgi:hypothetical protein